MTPRAAHVIRAPVPIRRNLIPLAMLRRQMRGAKPRRNLGERVFARDRLPFAGWALRPRKQTENALADASQSLANEAAKRYASALFELAQDAGALSDVSRDFAGFARLIRENSDLLRLAESPAYSREVKRDALVALAGEAGVHDLVSKFVGTMAANGRARDITAAQRAFDLLYAGQRGVKRAVARTAKPMSAEQRSRLEAILAKSVGGEVELTEEVDERLIGGIQLRVGSTLVDASLAAKIDRMNSAMKGA